jgi:hypothetical protein
MHAWLFERLDTGSRAWGGMRTGEWLRGPLARRIFWICAAGADGRSSYACDFVRTCPARIRFAR